ncbi:MAG: hypothetical protein ABI769_16030 [Pseudomonadota bacterium]
MEDKVPSPNRRGGGAHPNHYASTKRVASICLAASLAACSVRDSGISTALTALVKDDSHEFVDLGQIDGSEWDRVCFLTPYMSNEGTEKVLGFRWNSDHYTSIRENDGIAVLVLVKDDEVVSFAEHPRGSGDLSNVGAGCLPRAEAKLKRVRRADGWLELRA